MCEKYSRKMIQTIITWLLNVIVYSVLLLLRICGYGASTMIAHFLVFVGILHITSSQLPSPCPNVLTYETMTKKVDQWYGVLSLSTSEDLIGVWITVLMDRPVDLLGNWFGETSSSDNKEFSIINQKYRLEAGPPVSVRFFVKFNPEQTVPNVVSVRLNGRNICTGKMETTTPTLHISRPVITSGNSGRPTGTSSGSFGGSISNRPVAENGGSRRPVSNANRPITGGNPNIPTPNEDIFITSSNRPSSSPKWPGTVNNHKDRPSVDFATEDDLYSNPKYNDDRVFDNANARPVNRRDSDTYQGGDKAIQNSRPSRRPSVPTYGTTTEGRLTYGDNHDRVYSGLSNDGSQGTISRPTTRPSNINKGNGISTDEGDDDYFPGDFANLPSPKKPKPAPSLPLPTTSSSSCGTVSASSTVRPLIANGQDTTPGQWPWHAAMYHSKGIQLTYSCGGTLIADKFILTAAHCVTKPRTSKLVDRAGIQVYMGKYKLSSFGPEIQESGVKKIYVHPEYNATSFFNDIAILRLSKSMEVTDYVRPSCLWEGNTELDDIVDKQGYVVGWGFDENRNLSNKLMQAQMPVVSTVKCIYSNRDFFSQFTFEKNYCAGFRNGTSVCNGDSGGGMVFPKTVGRTVTWYLRGIVSVGVALQGQGVCDPSQYIVFTDVAKHLRWIKQILSNEL